MPERLPGAEDLREGLTFPARALSEPDLEPVEGDESPRDWLGHPVSCTDCSYEETRAAGKCDLGRTCVMDRRGRRIDRFFATNPGQAERHLKHPYFEVRAIAARYASTFRLAPLIDDPEPDVRAIAALRLPLSRVAAMARDPEPRVRMALAQRLEARRSRRCSTIPITPCVWRPRGARRRRCSCACCATPTPSVRREAARRAPEYALLRSATIPTRWCGSRSPSGSRRGNCICSPPTPTCACVSSARSGCPPINWTGSPTTPTKSCATPRAGARGTV